MANPLIAECLTLIEVAIKQAVKTDPVAARRLAELQGQVLEVQLTSPFLQLFILPVADGIEFTQSDLVADCQISGAWVDFLAIAEDEHRLFGSGVQIHGNQQLVKSLKEILSELEIDWEALLADHLGDLPAHQLARIFGSAKRYAEHSSRLLLADLSDYLHEEIRVAPPKAELQQFYQGVDELRLRADRLQARVQLLEAERSVQK